MIDAIIIGAGAGGLSSALALAGANKSVLVVDALDEVGGKMQSIEFDGVRVDTGPSVFTMPEVLEEVFASANFSMNEEVSLLRPDPATAYVFPDGTRVIFRDKVNDTLDEIRKSLGTNAADECERFLKYTSDIWEVAAPNFIFSEAPSFKSAFSAGRKTRGMLKKLDPLRSMQKAIESQVKNQKLRTIFSRYATYNGSDPRKAPATLNCIAHVEVNVGLYGVEGGMNALPKSLARCAKARGVTFELNTRVKKILHKNNEVAGVLLEDGRQVRAKNIIANADVRHVQRLLGVQKQKKVESSMSGFCAIFKTKTQDSRAGHTVFAIDNYMSEFDAVFQKKSAPKTPTVYASAPRVAHKVTAWKDHEPLFVMANAPAGDVDSSALLDRCIERLQKEGALQDETLLWSRTPKELSEVFPDTEGAIYGASSNTMFAAFQRQANKDKKIAGLYYASGSAHPGGGVPLCLRSGLMAADACLGDDRFQKDAA